MADKPEEAHVIVVFKGIAIAKLFLRDLDWPWYDFEVVPTTFDDDLKKKLFESSFYNFEREQIEFRHSESGEFAISNGVCFDSSVPGRLWFRGIRFASQPNQRFRIHLSTAIVMMFTIAFLMLFNLTIRHHSSLATNFGYGWPIACYFPQSSYSLSQIDWVYVALDTLANLTLFFVVGYLAEYYARSRLPVKK